MLLMSTKFNQTPLFFVFSACLTVCEFINQMAYVYLFLFNNYSFALISLIRAKSADVEPVESTSPIVSSTTHGFIGSADFQVSPQQQQPHPQLLEDTCSTDSSSFDGGEFKKRRRKLHFPFGKKSHKAKQNSLS